VSEAEENEKSPRSKVQGRTTGKGGKEEEGREGGREGVSEGGREGGRETLGCDGSMQGSYNSLVHYVPVA